MERIVDLSIEFINFNLAITKDSSFKNQKGENMKDTKRKEKVKVKVKVKVKAIFDGDTKRKHRFLINGKDNKFGISGALYLDKETDIPDLIKIKIADKEGRV